MPLLLPPFCSRDSFFSPHFGWLIRDDRDKRKPCKFAFSGASLRASIGEGRCTCDANRQEEAFPEITAVRSAVRSPVPYESTSRNTYANVAANQTLSPTRYYVCFIECLQEWTQANVKAKWRSTKITSAFFYFCLQKEAIEIAGKPLRRELNVDSC